MKYSINVTIPPATDLEGLIGIDGALMANLGIESPMQGKAENVSHPIEESRATLLEEFQTNHHLLGNLMLQYTRVEVVQAKVVHDRKLFIQLECSWEREDYVHVPFSQ